MKKTIITLFLMSLITGLCSCTSSSTTSYDGMSNRYYTDSEYRNNVNSSSRAYSVSPKQAEDSANRVLDAIR